MSCACKSDDRYECWSVRYGTGMRFTCEQIDLDGGPCECSCHDEYDLDPRTPEFGVAT